MQILGHGVDIVAVDRIRGMIDRQGEGFTKRVFSPGEFEYCQKMQDPAQHFAARFAAKEAYGKALGVGIGASKDLQEVEVLRPSTGGPKLGVNGKAAEQFSKFGGQEIFLSISHDGGIAMASVIIMGNAP